MRLIENLHRIQHAGALSAGGERISICAFETENVFERDGRRDSLLKYLWMVIQDLLLTVTVVSWMHALLFRMSGKKGSAVHGILTGAGTAAAIVLAAVKLNTRLIVSSRWNHYIYAVYIAASLVFLIVMIACRKKAAGDEGSGGMMPVLAGGAVSAVLIFYSLPSVLLYPFSFNTMGNGYLSRYYLVRLGGWALGLLLLAIYAALVCRCAKRLLPRKLLTGFLLAAVLVYGFYCFSRFFVPWVNRAKWLKWPVKYSSEQFGWIGGMIRLTSDHSMLFIWLAAAMAAVSAVWFFSRNIKVTEPYDNPAQKRKIRAKMRGNRRNAAGILVLLLGFTLILTLVKAYDTRTVVLSAPETFTVEDDRILIPMESVSDGHLHRFEYKTENDIDVRWIVVKKPGSASFGVGLDACEVCGNAGYYEKGGQVICRRCDVVMNINTIGFKGGCNPIPLKYEVDGGNLVFLLEDIEAGEKEFR